MTYTINKIGKIFGDEIPFEIFDRIEDFLNFIADFGERG